MNGLYTLCRRHCVHFVHCNSVLCCELPPYIIVVHALLCVGHCFPPRCCLSRGLCSVEGSSRQGHHHHHHHSEHQDHRDREYDDAVPAHVAQKINASLRDDSLASVVTDVELPVEFSSSAL